VLGLTRPRCSWQWAAVGKHPSAKDYISIGQLFPLAASFSNWMHKGYPEQKNRCSPVSGHCCWRFWARGGEKNQIVCGLLRDSSDSIGRPYPLLIIGTGPLPDWVLNWELLPCACEETWLQMEKFSTQTTRDVTNLEQVLTTLRPPAGEWNVFQESSARLSGSGEQQSSLPDADRLISQVRVMAEKDMGKIILTSINDCDKADVVLLLCRILKGHMNAAPRIVFVGGTFDTTGLVFFRRSLNVTDFTMLWSDTHKDNQGKQ
jgi:type VI secretion system protein VasJ